MSELTEREKALMAYAFCNGKECGHYETVEGTFWGNGRSEVHIESAKDFIDEIDSNDHEYALEVWRDNQ